MIIDWSDAIRVGLVGFGVVFFVLVILAVAIWLTGKIVGRMDKSNDKPAAAQADGGANNNKEGA
jgi:sodium pump decarboxylase gamma subunit